MSNTHRSLALLFLAIPAAFAAPALASRVPVLASCARGQDPAPVPDKRPEVNELVTKLKAFVDKEGLADRDAITVIDQMNQEFPNSGPKDKALIVKSLSRCFEARRQEKEGEARNNQLYLASAVALGQMGPESTKTLISWIGHKNHKKDTALQHRLILSLGKTHDKDGVRTLVQNLDNVTASLVGAAAEALGEYAVCDLETRKSVFESLLKILMAAQGAKDQDYNNNTLRDRFDVIAAPIITSLGKLSKYDERVPDKWQTWWNKNKKADWDAEQ